MSPEHPSIQNEIPAKHFEPGNKVLLDEDEPGVQERFSGVFMQEPLYEVVAIDRDENNVRNDTVYVLAVTAKAGDAPKKILARFLKKKTIH